MAWSDAEIERVKAPVPEIYRPRDAAGTLSDRFDLSVDLLRKSTPLQGSAPDPREHFNLGQAYTSGDPDAPKPSFILTGGQASKLAHHIQTERQRRDDLRLALDHAQSEVEKRLAERLAALDIEIAAIDARVGEITARRTAIGESLDALDDVERLAREHKLDPNNEEHRRLLEKAGIDPDTIAGSNFAAVIAQRRRDLDAEDSSLDTEWNARMKRRGQVVIARGVVMTAQGEIENADTEEARLLAERRAATTLGAQQLGEAATWTRSQQAKVIAADAVGISAESKTLNRRAATEHRDSTITRKMTGFELNDEGPPTKPAGAPQP